MTSNTIVQMTLQLMSIFAFVFGYKLMDTVNWQVLLLTYHELENSFEVK